MSNYQYNNVLHYCMRFKQQWWMRFLMHDLYRHLSYFSISVSATDINHLYRKPTSCIAPFRENKCPKAVDGDRWEILLCNKYQTTDRAIFSLALISAELPCFRLWWWFHLLPVKWTLISCWCWFMVSVFMLQRRSYASWKLFSLWSIHWSMVGSEHGSTKGCQKGRHLQQSRFL